MANGNGYWGEIPQVADTESGIAALEREQITKPRPLDIEGPLLHQPSSRHHPPTNEVLPSEHFQMDPLVIHTIRLIQHIKKLKAAISALQQDTKQEVESGLTTVGQVPQYDGPPIRDRSRQKYFTEEEYQTDFVRGVGKAPAPIDEITCRKLLRRSTAAICAHLSFDTTADSVLETLTDVCQEFLIQFTKHLGVAADRRAVYGSGGFPDIVERVFHEMGVGSVQSVHEFYQQRVINYRDRMEEQCRLLMAEYNKLSRQPVKQSSQSPNSSDTLHVIRIKDEYNSEIQFPLLDENDEVNEAEQLLNIETLGQFEITVEHETTTGLTTEVDTKWSHTAKGNAADARSKQAGSTEEGLENPGSAAEVLPNPPSNIPITPQSNVPQTPQELVVPILRSYSSQDDATIQDPGSISSMDIFSPSVPTPSKAKKKKVG
ncbi:STAGA complex 65 subunit gamma-like [Physella acuta]|uniref:STAGA complex 65 subunit gamma-like n=1 Tax=Physella acuta TaxID=109671 RepID=UPI0027DD306B|nr:STAGA complex 65 subunit gamma-like [Physella acuta]XP_059163157.1 STAGA complex 65 subunit gamma-like [Physella acuta]XP_059163158.1 STAGA complex 65 subunit gamma-like [Physella acuta]